MRLQHYDVVREIGRGGFGVVYEAHDCFLERQVAIKTILPESFAGRAREDFEKRFLHEARAAGRLNHPNIVSVFQASSHEGLPFLVMEYVTGKTLRRVLDERGTLPLEETMPLADQLLGALEYAHGVGVVHRDIKPENLLVREDGVLKVTDFGVAKLMQSTTATMTKEGAVMGTPSYMAPEQILSQPVNGRADLFATSAILYEMMTGCRAFSAETVAALLYKILAEAPLPMTVRVGVPAGIQTAIMRGLEKKAENRFATARDLREALRTAMNGSAGMEASVPPRVSAAPELPVQEAISTELSELLGRGRRPADSAAPTVSFRWVPPTLSRAPEEDGTLQSMPVPELLLSLRRRRERGMLVLEDSEGHHGLELEAGLPVGAHGGPVDTALGPSLKRLGLLDDTASERLHAEFGRCSAREPGVRLGDLAVKLGYVTPAQLLSVLEHQVDERVRSILGILTGRYAFYRGYATGMWSQMAPRPLEGLMARHLLSRPPEAAEFVGSFLAREGKKVVASVAGVPELLPSFQFGAPVQRFLRGIVDRTVGSALDTLQLPRADAEVVLYLLWAAGGIVTEAARPPVAVVAPPSVAPPLPTRTTGSVPRVEVLPVRTVKPEWQEKLDQAEAATKARELPKALDLLARARALAPRNARILELTGFCTFSAQPAVEATRREAKAMLEQALAIEPDGVMSLLTLARIARMESDYAGARRLLERVLALEPGNVEALSERRVVEGRHSGQVARDPR